MIYNAKKIQTAAAAAITSIRTGTETGTETATQTARSSQRPRRSPPRLSTLKSSSCPSSWVKSHAQSPPPCVPTTCHTGPIDCVKEAYINDEEGRRTAKYIMHVVDILTLRQTSDPHDPKPKLLGHRVHVIRFVIH